MLSTTDKHGKRHTVSVLDVFGGGRTIRRNKKITASRAQLKGKSNDKSEDSKDKVDSYNSQRPVSTLTRSRSQRNRCQREMRQTRQRKR